MRAKRDLQILRAIPVLIVVCLTGLPAEAKYSGGTGEPNDPYQIATAADLIALGNEPNDYDKHFILTVDIDLDPNLPGRKVFDRAVIASKPSWCGFSWEGGTPFSGVFDGNGHWLHNYRGTDALFGYVAGATAEVKNLGLAKPDVAADDASSLLVAYLEDGTISNCDVQDCNFSTRPRHLGAGAGGLVWQNNGTIINCHISGQVSGGPHCIGGLVASNGVDGTITCCSFSGSLLGIKGDGDKGGLVGWNSGGISFSYSTGLVPEGDGLVGYNSGVISNCYSTSNVSGGAGLVGYNLGIISNCYNAGTVSGGGSAGGLVGRNYGGVIAGCFWDIQTSGQSTSAGGTGKTTAEMQTAKTFLDAGWDFAGETQNGTEDIWWVDEGEDYPRFLWEQGQARPYCPSHGAVDVVQPVVLRWRPVGRGMLHDVYFGEDKAAVASATPASEGVYRGRQASEVTNYDPGPLEWGQTYYWRIDEINEADPNGPKGAVWSFTTADFIVVAVVDDFERYTETNGSRLYQTWLAGWANGTNSWVGNTDPPFVEQVVVHGGQQSMPMEYYNDTDPWYSEAERTWETSQDWTIDGTDTLTLYFRGETGNGRDPLYVAIEDSAGGIAVVPHPDPNAVLATQWQKWHIPLADLRAVGVDVAAVKTMVIGIGDRSGAKPGGTGKIYIDDIRLTKRVP